MTDDGVLVPVERIAQSIYLIRGEKVILDEDLARLYGVETRVLNQSVRRHLERFPDDFLFGLTHKEFANLKSQTVTSRWGGRRKLPLAFTEQGVAMLSSVLKSDRAVKINVLIMRAFVRLRKLLSMSESLARKIDQLEQRMKDQDQAIAVLFMEIRELLEPPPDRKKGRMGFRTSPKKAEAE